ncbi:hypothetical protein [Mycolicibacterium iranicum]|uniref:Uncharacterized protein n=1 Tax=Mycolicibacterium iranicum TaxID=912594 RepID=A0ABT4HPU3_MYCIR|nr:hypothetical protein [Mycolicibacterium iranicum]MCZ0732211.1 hypothetical protein [Mycolicibacterium iranicum]
MRRKCETCGDGFLGSQRKKYCTDACRQKAARRRRPGNAADRNADRNVTVGEQQGPTSNPTPGAHCVEAKAVLDGLDAELAQSAKRAGRPLGWSTADRTLRELIASTIDRKASLQRLYEATDDPALTIKLAAELRMLTTQVAALLKQVKVAMPAAPSQKSQKAAHAANTRWSRESGA